HPGAAACAGRREPPSVPCLRVARRASRRADELLPGGRSLQLPAVRPRRPGRLLPDHRRASPPPARALAPGPLRRAAAGTRRPAVLDGARRVPLHPRVDVGPGPPGWRGRGGVAAPARDQGEAHLDRAHAYAPELRRSRGAPALPAPAPGGDPPLRRLGLLPG